MLSQRMAQMMILKLLNSLGIVTFTKNASTVLQPRLLQCKLMGKNYFWAPVHHVYVAERVVLMFMRVWDVNC